MVYMRPKSEILCEWSEGGGGVSICVFRMAPWVFVARSWSQAFLFVFRLAMAVGVSGVVRVRVWRYDSRSWSVVGGSGRAGGCGCDGFSVGGGAGWVGGSGCDGSSAGGEVAGWVVGSA